MSLILAGARRKILPQSKKGFKVQTLFMNGEAGGVYDPSDLTAEKVAWRRNLLTWSEDFTNAAWTKGNSSITPNAGTSWDGTATASKLVENTASSTHQLFQNYQATAAGGPVTWSVYAKAAERSVIALLEPTGIERTFNLSTGVATGSGASMVNAGNGWWRCIASGVFIDTANRSYAVRLSNGTTTTYTGDGTSGVLIDSAQVEQSPTATAYQRITDFTSDFLAAFPTHGLYQDAAGTTPVTALGQPVGLVIDSKTGGLANLGPELVTNGSFSSGTTGWAAGGATTLLVASGVMRATNATDGAYFGQQINVVAGRTYRISATFGNDGTSKAAQIYLGTTLGSGDRFSGGGFGFGLRHVVYTATATETLWVWYYPGSFGSSNYILVDDATVRQVPGVHAIQPTNSSRPLLDGRVNLLTFSEQFDNAAWTLVNPGTRTANTDVAPDGTTTADTLTDNITGNYTGLRQSFSVPNGSQSYVGSLYFKKTTGAASFPGLTLLYSGGTIKASSVAINTDTGVATARTGEVPDSVEVRDAGAYWRVFVTSANNASGNTTLQMDIWAAVNTNGGATWAATTQGSAVIWGADLRLAADAAYPYQRVAAATDYADVGVPRSFLFDGFDDSLYTASNMDLSGTDKVTVLAGVRKLSDAATGMLAETSAVSTSNNGAFGMTAPDTTTNRYGIAVRGTNAVVLSTTNSIYTAPVTNVLTLIGDIAAPVSTLRVNGAVAATNSGSLGTGNFGSYVLFIGRRNNATLPFSGKAYQLIVRGALTDDATLAQAQRYVAKKTGVTI